MLSTLKRKWIVVNWIIIIRVTKRKCNSLIEQLWLNANEAKVDLVIGFARVESIYGKGGDFLNSLMVDAYKIGCGDT